MDNPFYIQLKELYDNGFIQECEFEERLKSLKQQQPTLPSYSSSSVVATSPSALPPPPPPPPSSFSNDSPSSATSAKSTTTAPNVEQQGAEADNPLLITIHQLLFSKNLMKREGIRPERDGFINFSSILRSTFVTEKHGHVDQSTAKHLISSSNQFELRTSPYDKLQLRLKPSSNQSPPPPSLPIPTATGTTPTTTTTTTTTRKNEPFTQPRKHHHFDKVTFGTKNWTGFPVSSAAALSLQKASSILSGRSSNKPPHLSLGWCKTTQEFYNNHCKHLPTTFREICTDLSNLFYLKFSKFDVLGKEKNKMVVIYDPHPLNPLLLPDPTQSFKDLCERIWNMWRDAGQTAADANHQSFRRYYNKENTLEFAEIDGKLIYEMRAIKVKFHVTIGRGSSQDFNKIEHVSFPDIFIDPRTSYISAGRVTPFSLR